MPKSLMSILESIQEEEIKLEQQALAEAGDNLEPQQGDDAVQNVKDTPEDINAEDEGDDEGKDEKLEDHAPDGKGHYTADDLREIIDYVRHQLEEELKDDDEDDSEDLDNASADGDVKQGKKKDGDDIGEIGLDLIYEYADLLPETVINQIVDDLKDMFEIEDTMLESIITEGSAFFTKAKKSPAARAAAKLMKTSYGKNKKTINKRNNKWRSTEIGKKIIGFHKKVYKGLGKIKGKRCVHKEM